MRSLIYRFQEIETTNVNNRYLAYLAFTGNKKVLFKGHINKIE